MSCMGNKSQNEPNQQGFPQVTDVVWCSPAASKTLQILLSALSDQICPGMGAFIKWNLQTAH